MYNISYFVYLLEQQQQQENKQTSEGQHVPDQTQQHSDTTSTVSGKLSNTVLHKYLYMSICTNTVYPVTTPTIYSNESQDLETIYM